MTHMTAPTASMPETYFYYDSSDRSSGYEQYNIEGDGVGLYYSRDVQGRITGRYKDNFNDWNLSYAGEWYYHYTGAGDTPDYVRDTNWDIVEKTSNSPAAISRPHSPPNS